MQRAKRWNTAIFCVFVIIAVSVIVCFGIYKYQHTFTVDKWNTNVGNRHKIVTDMLEDYQLVGKEESYILSLLGKEDSEKSSFKGSREFFPPETTLVYSVGIDYMDNIWLIISLENGVAIDYCFDVT